MSENQNRGIPAYFSSKRLLLLTAIGGLQTIVILITVSPNQAAETTKETLEELRFLKEETISIAVRHEQPISEAPANVYVITDEDIRQSGATDIPTVLRRIPGIEVMQMSGAEFNVSVRGDNQTSANKILILLDGRSIYLDVSGNNSFVWKAIPVTLPEIKRIEVLKGPASALYGFNAFDGVVNIITKSPEEMSGTTLQGGAGEFGTLTSSAIHGGIIGKFGYRLSLGRDQNNQWDNREALAFRSHKFNIQTEYALSDLSKLLISGGLVDVNRFDGSRSESVASSSKPAHSYAYVSYERPSFFLRSWWNGFSDTVDITSHPRLVNFQRVTDRDGSQVTPFSGNTYNIEAQHAIELGRSNQLTYGANYRHYSLSSSAIRNFSREDRLGFYLQDEWAATQTLSVVAGLRYDLHTEINGTLSPRLAFIYRAAPEHTFRIGMSVSYRPPTLFESQEDLRVSITLPAPIPSPPPQSVVDSTNLDPEQIISYEAGYQGWFLRHRVRVRADLFFNHISDLIVNRPTSPTTAGFLNDKGEADIYGGEASVEFLATRWLSGFANYSYQEVEQTFIGSARRGVPNFKTNAGLRAELENGLSSKVAIHHYGAVTYPISQAFAALVPFGVVPLDTTVGSYTLLNFRAGYRFWKEKAEVAISVFNALNDKHKEHPVGDIIGNRVLGWLTIKF